MPSLPAILEDIPAIVYHADPWGPSLSRSAALTLVSATPRHAWVEHPRLGGAREGSRQAGEDDGGLLHSLVLGTDTDAYEVVDVDDYRGNRAALRDAVIAAGKTPVKRKDYDAACASAVAVSAALREDLGVNVAEFRKEVTILWRDREGVLCRARLDLLSPDGSLILDLKFCKGASPALFERIAYPNGYDMQWAAYVAAVTACVPGQAGRIKMEFIMCDPSLPCAPLLIRPLAGLRSTGESRWRRARAAWRECMDAGGWPAWGRKAIGVDLPPWALSDWASKVLGSGEEPEWAEGLS